MYISKDNDRKTVRTALDIGETVRIADENRNSQFRRGFTIQNTYEIFRIRRVDKTQKPTVYYLEDLNGEEIQGIFYREELVPTSLPELYDIKVLRRKKVKGRTKYRFNSWVDETYITKI